MPKTSSLDPSERAAALFRRQVQKLQPANRKALKAVLEEATAAEIFKIFDLVRSDDTAQVDKLFSKIAARLLTRKLIDEDKPEWLRQLEVRMRKGK